MERLNDILHELGISKVKLAKFLGVSRQMIYNYLELDDINKWPKDKKVLLLNLLGIKSVSEIDNINVDTDYILDVETRVNNLFQNNSRLEISDVNSIFTGLGKKQKELLSNIISILKDGLEDEKDFDTYYAYKYLYYFLQAMGSAKELKYVLAYFAKAGGFVKPLEFMFDEDEQFNIESIMFSAMILYNSGGASKSRIAESHKRFVSRMEQKAEERLSRTMELNTIKLQALKELGYTELTEKNATDVWEKMTEIQSRKVTS